jgi:hypothetical protein
MKSTSPSEQPNFDKKKLCYSLCKIKAPPSFIIIILSFGKVLETPLPTAVLLEYSGLTENNFWLYIQ